MTEELPRFAQWLAVSMDNLGLSGRKLAKLLDYHDTSVSKWKAGDAVPSVATLMKIAEIFDVPPPRLLVTARPDEFAEKDFGPPLEIPSRQAYWMRAQRHIKDLPLEEHDARELQALLSITQMLRESDMPVNGQHRAIADALTTIRKVVRGDAAKGNVDE